MKVKIFKQPSWDPAPQAVTRELMFARHDNTLPTEVQTLLQQAEERVSKIQSEAYTQAEREMTQKFQAAMAQFESTTRRTAEEEVKRVLTSMEEDIIRLALAAAEKVCHVEIKDNRSIVTHIVQEGLTILARHGRAQIRIHPSEVATVQEWLSSASPAIAKEQVEIETDPTVEAGGAVLEAHSSLVDGQVSTRLHQIRDAWVGNDHV